MAEFLLARKPTGQRLVLGVPSQTSIVSNGSVVTCQTKEEQSFDLNVTMCGPGQAACTSCQDHGLQKRPQYFDTSLWPPLHAPEQLQRVRASSEDVATYLIEGGAELTTLRDNLRDASFATTSMYLHTDDARRTKQVADRFAAPRS